MGALWSGAPCQVFSSHHHETDVCPAPPNNCHARSTCFDTYTNPLSFLHCPLQAKLLSAEFKEISEDDKAEWNEKADADKQRYPREMEDYVPPSDDSDSDDGGK